MNPPRTLHAVTNGASDARHDLRQRDIVDDALHVMHATGTLPALEFLKSHEISTRIITRVLLDPAHRRDVTGMRPA